MTNTTGDIALASNGGVPFANSVITGYPLIHSIPNLNDGLYGNSYSWIGEGGNEKAGIDLPGTSVYNVSSFAFGRANGDSFVIVNNDPGDTVTVTAPFKVGGVAVPEGGSFIAGGNRFVITYAGGTNSNDIVLTVQNFTTQVSLVGNDLVVQDIASGGQNDTLTIKSDTTKFIINDPNRVLGISGTITGATVSGDLHTVFVPFTSVAGNVLVNTLGGNDSLTVDLSLGNFSKTVTYDGGTQTTSDSLTLTGGATFASVTHSLTNASSGSVAVTGNSTISYTGLEPVFDNLSATDRVFTFNGGSETITVTDGTASDGKTNIDSTLSESVYFVNPTNSLTINAGTNDDIVTITSVDATYNAALTINGDAGSDTVNLNGDITFASGKSLIVNAESVTTGASADLTTSGAGVITFTADDVAIHATSTLVSASTVTLKQQTASRAITLGTEVSGELSLTDTELDRVTAATLQIGDSSSGTITFQAQISLASSSVANLALTTGGSIVDSFAGTEIVVANLTLTAVGTIGGAGDAMDINTDSVAASTTDAVINLGELNTTNIAAAGLRAGTATVILSGGTFVATDGTSFDDTSDLRLGPTNNATFDLYGFSETIDSLSSVGSDDVITSSVVGAVTLAVGNSNGTGTTYSGAIQDGAGTVALTKIGGGTQTLSGANTYTGATTVDDGRLHVNGSITSNVTVNSNGTLGGTGTVNGTVASTGTIAPGTSVGILNSGSVSLTGGTFAVEIGGPNAGNAASDHDQLNVSGTVALGNGVAKLTLAGGYVPVVGDDFVSVNNNGSSDFTTGYLLDAANNPLYEGAAVSFNGKTLFITYNGGDGNDVVLNTSAIVNGTDAADSITLTPQTGGGLQYVLNGNPAVTLPGPLASFTFNAQGGDDLMTVNLNANALPSGGIFYNGEEHDSPLTSGANTVHGDVLRVVGTTTQTATYLPDGVVNALLDNDGKVTVAGQGVINFTGLEPVDLQDLALANVNFPNGADILSIATGLDAATNLLPALVVSGTSGGVGFEQVHLRGNTQVAINTVTGGSDGADSVVFNGVNVAHGNAALSIDTGANSDSISFAPLAGPVAVSLTARGSSDGFSGSVSLPATPTTFTNVDVLTGSNSSGDSLTMTLDTATTWNLTGGNAGNVNVTGPASSLAFTGFENLTGAPTAGDTFVIGATASLTGQLDGRGPSGTLVGSDTLDYSAWSSAVAVNLATGAATAIFGGAAGGLVTDAVGSSIENMLGGSVTDVLTGDADRNVIRGNAGGDTLNGGANIDDIDGGDQDDTINVANNEAEFDTLQGGLGYDQLVNLGATVDVKLNAFNTAFDAWNNGLEEYLGNGARVIGNGGANGLHFGFTKLTNTTGVNSGLGDDGVTTSYDNTSLVAYDGDAGADQVTLVFTPSQLDALTTADILVVQDYVASPTLKTLSVTNVPAKGNFTATNFETARLAVYDDGLILDITTCFAQIQTQDQIIRGGAGDNVITGTPLVDLIFGEMGNDTINGLDSGDCLFGGAGNDLISGDAGNDRLSGGSGNDTLNGGVHNDAIFGGSGDDFLAGDTGYDNLQGGAGADTLDGGLHDDILNGGVGIDNISGGDGYDTIQVQESEAEYDTMNGGANTDTIVNLGAAPVVLNAFSAATNSIEVWQGNGQPIVGNSGANVLNFQISAAASLSLSGVPYVDGGAGDDTITGTNSMDDLRGGAGNDTLFGLGGVDTLSGGADNDSLNGGDGVDYLYGDDGVDTITRRGYLAFSRRRRVLASRCMKKNVVSNDHRQMADRTNRNVVQP